MQGAYADFSEEDPDAAQKFQADILKGDGNAAMGDLSSALKSGAISKADADALADQVGPAANQYGGGKVSSDAVNEFKAAGGDTSDIDRGSHHAAYEAKKFFGGLVGASSDDAAADTLLTAIGAGPNTSDPASEASGALTGIVSKVAELAPMLA